MKKLRIFYFVLAIFFIALGFLIGFAPGYSFSAYACFGIAALLLCLGLLSFLQDVRPMLAKSLRTVLLSVVLWGLAAAICTGAFIVQASFGQSETSCEYIVVLGAKVNGTHPSLTLSERIQAAYDYLQANPNTICIASGGQGPDEGISEGQCIYNKLTEMGIASERIWIENKSTSTMENLDFSLDLIEEKTGARPDSVGLVSSEYHLFRAGLMAADCGITAVGIPAQTGWLSLRINYYMREVAGVWFYLIFGG